MELFTPSGKKVEVATFNAGRLYEKEEVKRFLKKGVHYTVEKTIVHNFSSEVYLKEFPAISFNTVFFKNVDPVSKEEIKDHPEQF